MAKKITIDIEVNGKMQKATVSAKKLRNELEGVDTSQQNATKSQDKYKKGLKGVGQQSANASKNFAKFSGGMDGLVGVYASLAAQLFAVSAAFQFLKGAGNLESLKAGQQAYAAGTGVALRTLTNDIINATNAQVTFSDAAQAAAIGSAAGLSADQLTRLGKSAADAGQILGRDVTDSFNRLVRGVTKAEPELLDELGIILRLKDASDAYAQQLGTTAEKLTQAQKSQAVANDVLGQAERKYSAILDVVGRTPNEFAQLGKAFDDITNKIKEVAALVAGPFATALKETPELAFGAFALLLSGPMKAMGFSFKDIANDSKKAAKSQEKDLKKLKKQRESMINTVDKHKAKLRDLAKTEKTSGTKSKVVDTLAGGGTLNKKQQASFERSLKFAEANVDKHGKITAGMFKGRDAKIIASFRTTMTNMETASDKTVSRYKVNMKQMEIATTAFGVKARAAFAGIAGAAGKLLGAFGWIGIIVLAYQTVTAALDKYKTKADDTATEFDKQQAIYDSTIERLASLNEEYKKLGEVTAVRISLADDLKEVDLAAKAVSQSIVTTFNPKTIDVMNTALANYSNQTKEVEKNQEMLMSTGTAAKVGALATIAAITAVGVKTGIAGAKAGALLGSVSLNPLVSAISGVVGGIAGLTAGAVIATKNMNLLQSATKGVSDKAIKLTNKDKIFSVDEDLKAVPERIKGSLASLEKFRKGVEETEGITNFSAFANFEDILGRYKKASEAVLEDGATEKELENLRILGQVLKQNIIPVSDLNAHLNALPDQLKAYGEAFSAIEQSIVPRSAGDQLRLTAQAALESAEALAKSRTGGRTENDTKLINKLEARVKLGEKLAQQENDRAISEIKLQTSSIRNYDRLSKAQGASLKHMDNIAKSGVELNNLEIQRLNIANLYTKDAKGKYAPEVERQLDKIKALKEQEKARLELLEEQLIVLKEQKPFQEAIERQKGIQKVLGYEKQILDMQQKGSKAQIDTQKLRLQTAMDMAQESFDSTTGVNPFINQERAAAEFKLQQAAIRLTKESEFIKAETAAKKEQINMEYTLLKAKRTQTIAEMNVLKTTMKQNPLFNDKDLAALDNAISSLSGINLDAQKRIMLDNADAQGERAQYTLENGARAAARALEAEDPFNKLFNSAIDSLERGLQDAVMLIFDSLGTDVEDFNERMKEIGRGIVRSIQEELTKQLIVTPIMDQVGKLFNFDSDADKINTAILNALQDPTGIKAQVEAAAPALKTQVEDAGVGIADKITTALNNATLQIKIDCCDAKPPESVPEPTKVSEASLSPAQSQNEFVKGRLAEDNAAYSAQVAANMPAQAQQMARDYATPPSNIAGSPMAPTLNTVSQGTTLNTTATGEGGDQKDKQTAKLTDSLDNLTVETVGNITALGSVFAGLTGNEKAAQKLAAVTTALKLYQMGESVWKKLFGVKDQIATAANTAALVANTSAQAAGGLAGKTGGIFSGGTKMPGYATGGVARGSRAGYPVELHGTEAVVPLPNGRSIPVEMSGNGSQSNNVTVNVAVDNQGRASSGAAIGNSDGLKLGNAISDAVKRELLNQKRVGGILSPYGVA